MKKRVGVILALAAASAYLAVTVPSAYRLKAELRTALRDLPIPTGLHVTSETAVVKPNAVLVSMKLGGEAATTTVSGHYADVLTARGWRQCKAARAEDGLLAGFCLAERRLDIWYDRGKDWRVSVSIWAPNHIGRNG